MTWNYRIIRRIDPATGEIGYSIHEAYYNKAGEIYSITAEPVAPFGESSEELLADLENMLKDAKSQSVLDWDCLEFAPADD